MITLQDIKEIANTTLSNRELFSFMIQVKSQMQVELRDKLNFKEVNDIQNGIKNENIIDKMISIASIQVSSYKEKPSNIYAIAMAAATILKELDYPEFVSNEGLLSLIKRMQ